MFAKYSGCPLPYTPVVAGPRVFKAADSRSGVIRLTPELIAESSLTL